MQKIIEREAEVDVNSTAPELRASNAIGIDPTRRELKGVRVKGMIELTRLDQRLSTALVV